MKKSMEIIGNEQKNDGYFLVYSSWIVLVDKKILSMFPFLKKFH